MRDERPVVLCVVWKAILLFAIQGAKVLYISLSVVRDVQSVTAHRPQAVAVTVRRCLLSVDSRSANPISNIDRKWVGRRGCLCPCKTVTWCWQKAEW